MYLNDVFKCNKSNSLSTVFFINKKPLIQRSVSFYNHLFFLEPDNLQA